MSADRQREMTLSKKPVDRGLGVLSKLPAETRNTIYGYVLLAEPDVYPFQSTSFLRKRSPSPDLALFLVNKTVNTEAVPILYANAIFHIITGPELPRFLSSNIYTFPSYLNIRSVGLVFKAEPTTTLRIAERNKRIWKQNKLYAMPRSERMEMGHEIDMRWTHEDWIYALSRLESLAIFGRLRHLTLDLSDIICSHGCCRLHNNITSIFIKTPTFVRDVLDISIKGRFTVTEQDALQETLTQAKFVE